MTNEEVMQLMTDMGLHGGGMDDWVFDNAWVMFANAVASAEREACAKLCDDYEEWCGPWGQDDNQYAATESAMEIAKAIRARGNP